MGLWDSLMGFASDNPMQTGMLGLAGASDIMGAYSRAQAESRQRDIYNKLRDPNALLSLYQPMSAAGTTAVNRDLNSNLAMRGLTDGGAGNQYVADAWAKIEQQRQSDAVNQYIRALTGAGGNTGMPAGGSGATMDMMRNIMLYRALGNRQPPLDGQQPNPYGNPTANTDAGQMGVTGNPAYMNPYGTLMGGGAQLDPSLSYFGGGGGGGVSF